MKESVRLDTNGNENTLSIKLDTESTLLEIFKNKEVEKFSKSQLPIKNR